MKILLVCHRVPYPPNRGGKIRSFNMIRHLSQRHSVVVASLAHTEQEREEASGLEQYCEEAIVEVLGTATPCSVIPNGVDTTYFSQNGNSGNGGSAIVFLGRMHYFPNIDGVCYFANEVFPLIRQQVPNAEFRIVGSHPSRQVRN